MVSELNKKDTAFNENGVRFSETEEGFSKAGLDINHTREETDSSGADINRISEVIDNSGAELNSLSEEIDNSDIEMTSNSETINKRIDVRRAGAKEVIQIRLIKRFRQTEIGHIPADWTLAEIKQIADADQNHSFTDGDWIESKNQSNKGIRLIQTGNIGIGSFIDHESKKYISEDTFEELNCKEVFEGDILICRLADPIGRSCIVPNLETRAITSVDVVILRADTSRYDPEYVNYLMNSPKTLQRVYAFSSGSTRQRISRSHLGDIRLAFPPLNEQRKIAVILSSVDKAIELAKKVYNQTESVKRGLMQRLLMNGMSQHEVKESPIGAIPTHWQVGMLGDFLMNKPEYGANASAFSYSKTMPRYIRITDITGDGFLKEYDIKSIPFKGNEKYILYDGDFLIARTGNTVGKSYLYHRTDGNAIFAGYLIRFKLDQKQLLPKYFFYVTRSTYYNRWVNNTIRTGAQPNINAQEYSSLLIAVPPIAEQRKIVSILDSFTDKLNSEKKRIEKLQNIKQGLIQLLLTGDLRVTS